MKPEDVPYAWWVKLLNVLPADAARNINDDDLKAMVAAVYPLIKAEVIERCAAVAEDARERCLGWARDVRHSDTARGTNHKRAQTAQDIAATLRALAAEREPPGDLVEIVARGLTRQQIEHRRRHDHRPLMEEAIAESVNVSWRWQASEAQAALAAIQSAGYRIVRDNS